MSRVFFSSELDSAAIYWRIERRDGVALGFTTHDADLEFDGLRYRAAPGMLPSSIRLSASLEPDSAEVVGALSHDAITAEELAAGRFDHARVEIGLVDWETTERKALYSGEMGAISIESGGFEAELCSIKAELDQDTVPRTSPTCRATFCGPGCGLSARRFTHLASVSSVEAEAGRIAFEGGPPMSFMLDGWVRWIDGPHSGLHMEVTEAFDEGLLLDIGSAISVGPGMRALLREGCDHTLATCEGRFVNSINFCGEPFLPGNDALVRYPTSSS